MTNIKAKDGLLGEIKSRQFVPSTDAPENPTMNAFKPTLLVQEQWGWDQLSQAEYAEFLEQEAYASHIGQFIHKDSVLDSLRNELPKVKSLDWITVRDGERTPVKVEVHHTPEELLAHHEKLASLHRTHEQRVNYFKAKVKNLVTEENARISKENALGQAEVNKLNEKLRLDYTNVYLTYLELVKVEREEFEAARQAEIQSTAALRISIDPRFQDTIDNFLKKLDPES
jgi:BMFP domain-containing protein YqiC